MAGRLDLEGASRRPAVEIEFERDGVDPRSLIDIRDHPDVVERAERGGYEQVVLRDRRAEHAGRREGLVEVVALEGGEVGAHESAGAENGVVEREHGGGERADEQREKDRPDDDDVLTLLAGVLLRGRHHAPILGSTALAACPQRALHRVARR